MGAVFQQRQDPDFSYEQRYDIPVCGMDEAGRGPIAGPVVAACVMIAPDMRRNELWRQVRDSKKLSLSKREELYDLIMDASEFGIGIVSPAEIDDINIHHASLLAMQRAFEKMCDTFTATPEMALVDGKFTPKNLPCPSLPIVKGDSISTSIAAASILAKVTRDRIMFDLHEKHPHYGWASNAGYPTKAHIEALNEHGITAHHRKSYGPVTALLERGQ